MTLNVFLAFCAIALGGICLALQAPINARLGAHFGNVVPAAAVSFFLGFVVLGALTLVGGFLPTASQAASAPWWAWCGGILGAVFVWAAAWSVGPLSVVTMIAGLVFGQVIGALVLDAIGAFGMAVRDISWTRILAVLLVGAGLVLSRV